MDGSTTLTIRLDAKLKKRLGKLAESADRTKSYLAAAAIADYVAYEEREASVIRQRLGEVRSGKTKLIPHKEAMARLRATVNKVSRAKR